MRGKAIVWFTAGMLVAFGVVGAVWAAASGDSELRINARRLDDGRVEVGLQQRDDKGWGQRQLPQSRFLPADAETGRWLNSTPLSVSVAESGVAEEQPNTAPDNVTVPGGIESAARRLLADELDVDEGDLALDGSETVEWSDASLGCPQDGYGYAQVVTPGYRLVFGLAGASHAVHTNADGSHMVIRSDR
ncbi:MAG: hypothetical protein OXG42_07835 [Chloroflexi bacterium]|nr:hypothetical protein [Chloroflexota bacterium]